MILPTCVDYHKYGRKKYHFSNDKPITFGWVGSDHNLKYLELILPSLNEISANYNVELLVVTGYGFTPDKNFNFPIRNIPWDNDNEIDKIKEIDIGLMPLNDGPVEQGKCGFKLIQYMGCGVVSIASAVTINKEIIDHEVDGYLVFSNSKEEFTSVMQKAIENKVHFDEMGEKAYKLTMNKK